MTLRDLSVLFKPFFPFVSTWPWNFLGHYEKSSVGKLNLSVTYHFKFISFKWDGHAKSWSGFQLYSLTFLLRTHRQTYLPSGVKKDNSKWKCSNCVLLLTRNISFYPWWGDKECSQVRMNTILVENSVRSYQCWSTRSLTDLSNGFVTNSVKDK